MIRRWKAAVFSGLCQVQGLVGVLMKPRNGEPWTAEDKAFVWTEVRAMARWTPALVLFLLPGGSVLLPLLAWTLDRRRGARAPSSPLVEPRQPGGVAT